MNALKRMEQQIDRKPSQQPMYPAIGVISMLS